MSDWTEVTAEEVMRTPVKAIVAGASLDDALELLADERISGAVVTTTSGRPVGVISQTDIVSHMAGLERDGRRGGDDAWSLRDRRDPAEGERTLVEAVMTPELVSVDVSARLPEVCRVMLERSVHRVLVVEDGPVVGIISTIDVIRALHDTWRARSRRSAKTRSTKTRAAKAKAPKAKARVSAKKPTRAAGSSADARATKTRRTSPASR